jgi:hypothetical protein
MKISPFTLLPLSLLAFIAPPTKAQTVIRSVPYIIDSPGVYVLGSSMTCTQSKAGTYAIEIKASDVTLNFQGYSINNLVAGPNSLATGVAANNEGNITVENGTLNGFSYGVILGGVDPNVDVNNVVQNMKLSYEGAIGIFLTYNVNAIVRNCQIANTGLAQDGTVIYAGGVAIEDEFGQGTLYQNNSISGATAVGIYASGASQLVEGNFITSCGAGILCGGGGGSKALNNVVSACPTSYSGVNQLGNTNF